MFDAVPDNLPVQGTSNRQAFGHPTEEIAPRGPETTATTESPEPLGPLGAVTMQPVRTRTEAGKRGNG